MIRIHGDTVSGNCLKVKWTADLLGVASEWVQTSVAGRETRTEAFLRLNPAGQVPIVVLEDGTVLAQSNAIMLYLNRQYGGALVPSDPLEEARVLQWLFWEQYSHEPVIAVRRAQKLVWKKPEDEIDPTLIEKGHGVLALMQRHLETHDYFVADRLTAADIALVAYTRVAPEGGFDLAPYPDLRAWIARVEGDLGLEHAATILEEVH